MLAHSLPHITKLCFPFKEPVKFNGVDKILIKTEENKLISKAECNSQKWSTMVNLEKYNIGKIPLIFSHQVDNNQTVSIKKSFNKIIYKQLGFTTIGDGAKQADTVSGLAVDSEKNIYLTGTTHGSLGGKSAGERDFFLSKFDSFGNHIWTKQFGTSSSDQAHAIAIDKSNNIYITGDTSGDFAEENGNSSDIFIIKLNSFGEIIWKKQLGKITSPDFSKGQDAARTITIHDNNIYLSGITRGDWTSGIETYKHFDLIIFKFDFSGNLKWTKQEKKQLSDDYPRSFSFDSQNNFYIVGFSNTFPGSRFFISKFDNEGNRIYTNMLNDSLYNQIYPDSMVIQNDALYVSGIAYETYSNSIPFIAKLDTSYGNLQRIHEIESETLTLKNFKATKLVTSVNSQYIIVSNDLRTYLLQINLSSGKIISSIELPKRLDKMKLKNEKLYLAGDTKDSVGEINAGSTDVVFAIIKL